MVASQGPQGPCPTGRVDAAAGVRSNRTRPLAQGLGACAAGRESASTAWIRARGVAPNPEWS